MTLPDGTVIVVPARGGSKGVPRKNLRPLGGKPLLAHAVETLRALEPERLIVSTDDDEIGLAAQRLGAEVHKRSEASASDSATVDDVIVECLRDCEVPGSRILVAVQPTSPLLAGEDVLTAVGLLDADTDTVVSVVEDTHLRWRIDDRGVGVPQFQARVNRQWLEPEYRETGAVVVSRAGATARRGSRFGDVVRPFRVPPQRSIDLDTHADFRIAESMLRQRRIAVRVVGSKDTGLGHVYRQLSVANDLVGHEIVFFLLEKDDVAIRLVRERNYPVEVANSLGALESTINAYSPDLLINDCLDSSSDYAARMARLSRVSVTFEDLGPGAELFQQVFNALYPPASRSSFSGIAYFIARDEFIMAPRRRPEPRARAVLITFGGVDENNLTVRVLERLERLAPDRPVTVVLGSGYGHLRSCLAYASKTPLKARIVRETRIMSELMSESDLVITGGGRTVLEAASLGVPVLSISQNLREASHSWSREELGVLDLGLARDLSDGQLDYGLRRCLADSSWRKDAYALSMSANLLSGRLRVAKMLRRHLE